MKEQNTTNETIETTEVTEVVEVTEKVSVKEKVTGFCKKHKKGLIIGAAAVGAAVIGLVKVLKKSNNDDLYDYYSEDDYEDSDDVIDVEINEETTE